MELRLEVGGVQKLIGLKAMEVAVVKPPFTQEKDQEVMGALLGVVPTLTNTTVDLHSIW